MAQSFSTVLEAKLHLVSAGQYQAAGRIWANLASVQDYVDLLAMVHSVVRASVPLMEAARNQALARGASDPIGAPLAAYLDKHIEEEAGHDLWIVEDLAALGVPESRLWEKPPHPAVAAMVGAQYYWALHQDPVAIMGYMACIEGVPPSEAHLEEVMARTGLPREAFRFYLRHGEADPIHKQEIHDFLDALPMSEAQRELVSLSAIHTSHQLQLALESLPAPAGV